MPDPSSHPAMSQPAVLLRLLIFAVASMACLLPILLFASKHEAAHTVLALSNYLGTVTRGLEETGRMVMLRQGAPYIGVVPFYAARMPFPIYFLMALHKTFGDHFLCIKIVKTLLLFLPLLLSAWMALAAATGNRRNLVLSILFVPFLIPSFLLLATSLQVEEAFLYSFLSCALACLLYFRANLLPPWLLMTIFAICVDLTYLTKSSTRLVVFVLTAGMFIQLRTAKLRVLLCLLTLLAPLGWAGYMYHTTGRATVGSSLDGFNLHKGNYPEFLSRYPPADNGYMDKFDSTIIPTEPMFRSEWEDNDYHMKQGIAFVHRPGDFARALWKKSYVFFFSLRDIGSGHQRDLFSKFDLENMLLFRAFLLGSVAYSLWNLLRGKYRFASYFFLLSILATAAPFIIGFALTRHATILIYPSALALALYAGHPNSPSHTQPSCPRSE